jgi:hypothetical protein
VGRLKELLCRHDYVAVETGGDERVDFYVVRCEKCGKTKQVSRGDIPASGSHDIEMGRRPQLPRSS